MSDEDTATVVTVEEEVAAQVALPVASARDLGNIVEPLNNDSREWKEVPHTDRPKGLGSVWYSTVKKWKFTQYASSAANAINTVIELELMGGTLLRHIICIRQVKGVITKSSIYGSIEEVIIDLRQINFGYAADQLKLKFSSAANAFAFHVSLMEVLY